MKGKTSPRKAAIRNATDNKIADSVLEIIRCEGIDAVTIENVATRSGVAKTTIYRRYKDRYEMMAGVSEHLSETVVGDYPLTEDGFGQLIADIQQVFEDRVGLKAVGSILMDASELLKESRERLVSPSVDALREFLDRGVDEGVLSSSIDKDQIVEIIIGGLVVSDALRGDVPDEWGYDLARMLWPVISVDRAER